MAKKSHTERLIESLEEVGALVRPQCRHHFYGVLAGFGGDFTVAGSMKV